MDLGSFKKSLLSSDSVMELAKRETLGDKKLLTLLSRTFDIPIKIAGFLGDPHLEDYLTALYNLARLFDECEDGLLTTEEKRHVFSELEYCLGEITRRVDDKHAYEISQGERMTSVFDAIKRGAANEKIKTFVEHYEKSQQLNNLRKFDPEVRRIIDGCGQTMMKGMSYFLGKEILEDMKDLGDYAYRVAGVIGEALTEYIALKYGAHLDSKQSEQFGKYLQYVNIIKNIREDYDGKTGWPGVVKPKRSFIPQKIIKKGEETSVGTDYDFLMNNSLGAGKRQDVFDAMINAAKENFQGSVEYVMSIPEERKPLLAFCSIPLLAANKTFENMYQHGAEAVFKGDRSAIKINNEQLEDVVKQTIGLVASSHTEKQKWYEQFGREGRF